MLPEARGIDDVQRMFLVLAPEGGRVFRRVAIGKKRMPRRAIHEKEWGYVARVAESMDELMRDLAPESYVTKTQGLRTQAGPQEIASGTYQIRTHDDHVHLDYELDDSPLLSDLGIEERASFIVMVMNPLARWRGHEGPTEPSIFHDDLQEKFGDKKYAPLDPAFLDCEGCEIVLIGNRHEPRIAEDHGDRPEETARVRSGRSRAGA
jgi:hypothetical protein